MLSSGLQSPFSYTRLVKDGPSIIYKVGIRGEIRDVHWGKEQRRDKMRKREGVKEGRWGTADKINSQMRDEPRRNERECI